MIRNMSHASTFSFKEEFKTKKSIIKAVEAILCDAFFGV